MTRLLIVIGGPTASGKSALAVVLAQGIGGVVVNADAMQLYRDLPILTARPSPEEEVLAPHRLYGLWGASVQGSAGRWLDLVQHVLRDEPNRPLIVVGGTGLYLHALLHGIAAVPEIDPAVRADVRSIPAQALHPLLQQEDPALAAILHPTDPQRLMRGLEVIRATGRSLLAWQSDEPYRIALGAADMIGIALIPPRASLVARIERRLATMIETGALAELEAFLADPASASSPLRKAVAVPDLIAHLADGIPLDTALAAAVISTRRYAKRQVTFLRHRLSQLQQYAAFGDEAALQQEILDMVRRHVR
ncbi:MAG TPA: tRNA (adenosine(37)-N6)-dimethylallyltransferase MiaA [Geminicoccus sp.]|uniref:tRNA (adenosine(37)-N6)-dimethylallyltransferase MiaA n=1 Tax=Geminicoccus sp. TaxID=2024832 RepID=UPI002E370403|nr:tRNA (adenosine(37)-N6)-dimethylallyltransferase MiaA [Geminicoccus sp.]HEX2527274.1 tRNA (adenosine(37)-N6)-dimethylallyltransferase MiaA [Geminicoccus sp.]